MLSRCVPSRLSMSRKLGSSLSGEGSSFIAIRFMWKSLETSTRARCEWAETPQMVGRHLGGGLAGGLHGFFESPQRSHPHFDRRVQFGGRGGVHLSQGVAERNLRALLQRRDHARGINEHTADAIADAEAHI